MIRLLSLLVLVVASTAGALAQTPQTMRLCNGGEPGCPLISTTNGLPVSVVSDAGAMTTAGCTVGTSSGECLAASTATKWIQVQNTHGTNGVACSWGGTAILNNSGSFMLATGQSASWGPATGGVPTNALNCIASGAATPLYIEYR